MKLTGKQRGMLREVILAAYPKPDELRILLSENMEVELDAIIAQVNDYNTIVFNLIQKFQSDGMIDKFIEIAYEEKRENPKSKEFYQEIFPFSSDQSDSISEEEWRNLKNILDEINYDILEENCHKTLIKSILKSNAFL